MNVKFQAVKSKITERVDSFAKLAEPPCSGATECNKEKRSFSQSSEQWTLAEELVRTLRPFEVTTTFFSYKENISLVHPPCDLWLVEKPEGVQ